MLLRKRPYTPFQRVFTLRIHNCPYERTAKTRGFYGLTDWKRTRMEAPQKRKAHPDQQGLCVLHDGDTEQGEGGIGIPAIEA